MIGPRPLRFGGLALGLLVLGFGASAQTAPVPANPPPAAAETQPNPAQPTTGKRQAEDPNKIYSVPLGDSPWKGAEHAKITIVEFSDFL